MVSTCSSNSRLIKRSSIAVANSSNGSSSNSRNSSNNRGSSSISNSLGSKMISTGSSNSWFIKRTNSSVGVSNELSVQVKRTSIAIGTSISWGIASISCISCSNNWGSTSISQTCSKLGSKMVCTGSSNCWLINRSHSSIRVGLQTIETLARGYGHTGSKNQKLHICIR